MGKATRRGDLGEVAMIRRAGAGRTLRMGTVGGAGIGSGGGSIAFEVLPDLPIEG